MKRAVWRLALASACALVGYPHHSMTPALATAIYVAYGVDALDLTWIRDDDCVVVVHNDRRLSPTACRHAQVTHVHADGNVGFGRAVMLALDAVATPRSVICNPDTVLQPAHWDLLRAGGPLELATVPLVEPSGRPTIVSSSYPTPLSLILTAFRAGRLAPRGTRRRAVAETALRLAPADVEAARASGTSARFPLHERWLSGAVLSVDTGLLRQTGLDPNYFLYFEDLDLCRRIARSHPEAVGVVHLVAPGIHLVGGSARTWRDRRLVSAARLTSATRYARTQQGPGWLAAAIVLAGAARFSLPCSTSANGSTG